ncbi:hypothetical protein E5288_WYG007839 [Bos mutus]|uniref:Uncharacterized protein n=1 Tax=Bos mutus TaxID=72004 RepID=A0A6B0RG23_9CETA|nr:hypothetical protein [Bos mutus]
MRMHQSCQVNAAFWYSFAAQERKELRTWVIRFCCCSQTASAALGPSVCPLVKLTQQRFPKHFHPPDSFMKIESPTVLADPTDDSTRQGTALRGG